MVIFYYLQLTDLLYSTLNSVLVMSPLLQASPHASALISHMINKSLSTGVVPQNLSCAAVFLLLRSYHIYLRQACFNLLFSRVLEKVAASILNLIQNLIISMNHFNQVFVHFTALRLDCSGWSLTSFYLLILSFLPFFYNSISALLLILSQNSPCLSFCLWHLRYYTFLLHLVPFR